MSILKHARSLGLCLLLPIMSSACAYRFTNTSLRNPLGIQTIAVEAVWDESREVIPHELLWSAVQREIIRNGRVTLTNQDEADALMVVTITGAKVSPAGTPSQEALSKDPPNSDTDKKNPEDYRNIRRAGSWTTDEGLTISVHVDVFDLKSRAVLFKKDYSTGITFKSLRPVTITPTESSFLHYEEALDARFKAVSDGLAHSIANDFLM
ncbi:MAG: hypothetical protein EOP07_06095 [Proteobacteria bacterium]|nr:MAG: hypothetical protein EOP07_06095 [Pseudomonadota bacterium]